MHKEGVPQLQQRKMVGEERNAGIGPAKERESWTNKERKEKGLAIGKAGSSYSPGIIFSGTSSPLRHPRDSSYLRHSPSPACQRYKEGERVGERKQERKEVKARLEGPLYSGCYTAGGMHLSSSSITYHQRIESKRGKRLIKERKQRRKKEA